MWCYLRQCHDISSSRPIRRAHTDEFVQEVLPAEMQTWNFTTCCYGCLHQLLVTHQGSAGFTATWQFLSYVDLFCNFQSPINTWHWQLVSVIRLWSLQNPDFMDHRSEEEAEHSDSDSGRSSDSRSSDSSSSQSEKRKASWFIQGAWATNSLPKSIYYFWGGGRNT